MVETLRETVSDLKAQLEKERTKTMAFSPIKVTPEKNIVVTSFRLRYRLQKLKNCKRNLLNLKTFKQGNNKKLRL